MKDTPPDQPIRFLLGNELKTLADVSPTMTVLNYLRMEEKAVGTKEGCAEGDCGACTVVLGELIDGQLQYRAVNACILFLPMLDGKQLLTVEHLKETNGQLHPVQQSMVDRHASQCGFCTPGIVMSGFALYQNVRQNHQAWSELKPENTVSELNKIYAGNLCRCTGYGPILESGKDILAQAQQDAATYQAEAQTITQQLQAIQPREAKRWQHDQQTYIQPSNITELTYAYQQHPDANLLAGGTDLGLWVTKQHRELDTVIHLGHIPALKTIQETPQHIELGAAVTYSQAMPILCKHFPVLQPFLERHSSTQIRNSGTIVGNIANGSPIGDMPPPLIALGASITLNSAQGPRTLTLQDYFIDYGQQDRQPGEFIEKVTIPLLNTNIPGETVLFKAYKISKRQEQDISSVSAAFYIQLNGGTVEDARLCYGGMAGIPKRATATEKSLIGQAWCDETIFNACDVMITDYQPLDDFRASSRYRMTVAQNLLRKFFIEHRLDNQEKKHA